MDSRGPADPPPSSGQGSAPDPARPPETGAPAPGGASGGTVLSLEERKAERQRRRREAEAEAAPTPEERKAERKAERKGAAPTSRRGGALPRPREDGAADDPAAAPAAPAAAPRPFPQPAGPARTRFRHLGVVLSFLLLVVGPTALVGWYLWERASPRYVSQVGFSVRTEEAGSAIDLLGGMAGLAGASSSSSDTDILYRFIQSQEVVALLEERLDLRAIWAKGDPEKDPFFAYHPPGTIEDLHDHWLRMVSVFNDASTGLVDIEVQAFAPEDARAIAQAIYEESQTLINRLSDIAQEDRTRNAREELDEAVERLKVAREALTRFRNETQIVDPISALQGQMGILTQLEAQLAQTLIDLDLLRQSGGESDPRIEQALARVEVIEARMTEERQKLGFGRDAGAAGSEGGGAAFADLVGEYERLAVDQQFAEQAYIAAMASYDAALAEARQQSRYLAAHVEPTLAERAEYPRRWMVTMLTALFALLAWTLLALAGYALRDRR